MSTAASRIPTSRRGPALLSRPRCRPVVGLAGPARERAPWHGPVTRPGRALHAVGVAAVLALGALLLCIAAAAAQPPGASPELPFLDDHLPVPTAAAFSDSAYIRSGVGLSFGVDMRLSYATGNYAEAARQFEAAVVRYPYRAEIWVFLARSYYRAHLPLKAKDAIRRAATVMPDLNQSLWTPLTQGLLDLIRQQARTSEVQVDCYSLGPEAYLSLFRLCLFADDYTEAAQAIARTEARAMRGRGLAVSLAGGERERTLLDADRWHALAGRMRAEMASLGPAAMAAVDSVPGAATPGSASPPSSESVGASAPGAAGDASMALPIASAVARDRQTERARTLQNRVDFYPARPGEFMELFTTYLALGQQDRAAAVVPALDREIIRVQFEQSTMGTLREAAPFAADVDSLQWVRRQLRAALGLPDTTAPAAP